MNDSQTSRPVTEATATKLASKLNDKFGVAKTVAFDPMTILAIIEMIVQLVKLLQNCKQTPAQALVRIRKPNFFDRTRLWWLVRSRVGQLPELTRSFQSQFIEAFKATGAELAESDVAALFSENP